MDGAWGSTPSMEWRMSERATAALEGGEPAVGGQDDGRHHPDGEQDGHDGHADPQDGIDVAQVVPAHRDVAPGPDDPSGVAQQHRR